MSSDKKAAEKARIKAAWTKKLASFESRPAAAEKGYSFELIAQALGTTRQRIYNQIQGPAPISAALRAHLQPMLKLPKAPPQSLPKPRTEQDQKRYAREQQRRIQAQVDSGEIERIPPILLEDKKHIRTWQRLVKKHGGKTAAIRALLDAA